ncbi:MAG: hypothetical protein IPM35_35745 [Myxococcales bacterium]|nr:hypothetical protein [Myxococcales bacterium]
MLDHFRQGGWGMYPTAVFGVLLLLIAARYAVRPEARWLPLQIALGVLTLLTGSFGFVVGLIVTTAHLHEVPQGQVPLIGAIGFGESLHNVALALVLLVLAALCTSFGALRLSVGGAKGAASTPS